MFVPVARCWSKANCWHKLFNGCLQPMKEQHSDGPHPAYYHCYFPVKGGAPEPYLINPGFPGYKVVIPIPVQYTRSLLSRDFWERPGLAIKDFRRQQIRAISYQLEGENSWTRASESETEFYMRPRPSAAAIDRLLGLNPAERTIYGPYSVAANLAKIQVLEEESTKKTEWARAIIELWELSIGEPTYDDNLEALIKTLDEVIHAHNDILTVVHELEEQGEASAKGEFVTKHDCLTDHFQSAKPLFTSVIEK